MKTTPRKAPKASSASPVVWVWRWTGFGCNSRRGGTRAEALAYARTMAPACVVDMSTFRSVSAETFADPWFTH